MFDLILGVWEIKVFASLEPLLNLGGMLTPEPLAVVAKIELERVMLFVGV